MYIDNQVHEDDGTLASSFMYNYNTHVDDVANSQSSKVLTTIGLVLTLSPPSFIALTWKLYRVYGVKELAVNSDPMTRPASVPSI